MESNENNNLGGNITLNSSLLSKGNIYKEEGILNTSNYRHPYDCIYLKLIIMEKSAYPGMTVNGAKCRILDRDSERFSVCCYTIERNAKRSENDCHFGCSARPTKDGRSVNSNGQKVIHEVKLTNLNLEHKCCTGSAIQERLDNNVVQKQRKRNPNKSVLLCGGSAFLSSFQPSANFVSGKRSADSSNLFNSVHSEDNIRLTKQQASSYIRNDLKKDSYFAHAEQFLKLPSFILACQEADPTGFYYIATTARTYYVNNDNCNINSNCY